MGNDDFLIYLIWIGVIILIFMVFPKSFKFLIRSIIQGLGGAIGLMIFNFILSPIGWYVGVNWITIFIIAILGLPGFILLYIVNNVLY
ncbi:pro-sigmaK processing inhibitor BofA family protein [Defluviitalea phaphyphila]|uniref:pro-sigmaK processing inhibitor BofA family protein n=1 Tax=Defluviitalea phaphyphila TaxID=1473580 RepID=UPI00072FE51E|nr:pro-sigmaK processing inhibitor BofA family protein [Defluviitalea phaphyphila]